MAATPLTQRETLVVAQARLIELEHPEKNIPDDVLVGLATLKLRRLETAAKGTIYNIPARLDTRQGGIKELVQTVKSVFNRELVPHFPGGYSVQLKVDDEILN